MKTASRFGLVVLVMVLCTGCDQVAKNIAQNSLSSAPPVSLLSGVIRLEYLENPGATLGLGATLPSDIRQLVFIVAIGALLVMIMGFALRAKNLGPMQLIGLAMVAAGGLGNVLDRVLNDGAVIDFVSFGIGGIRTGVMNLADIAIFAGMTLVLIARTRRDEPTSA